jgi:2-methylcitrate dehydratase PrpD
MLQSAGGMMAAASLPTLAAGRSLRQGGTSPTAPANITGQLARYMVEARDRDLPPDVAREARHRILDTIGAIVSGARMKPGEAAIRYVRSQGGTPEASVLTTNIRTSAVNAALANGMFGHADETDDFEPVTKAHPGCAVVPAALAVAEREGRSGVEVVRAVALGYDLCCRFLMALGPDHVRGTHRSAEGTSATFGAAAAAASLARLDERGMRHVLSYAAQQVSGIWSWTRDNEHIEKAFDFGGMGARNGVTAALMVQSGFTGVDEVLDGEHNMIDALSTEPRHDQMIAGLGSRFFVTETAIKTFSVGYPIQAPLDALLTLRQQHGLTASNVERIVARLPEDERMKDPQVLAVKQRVELIGDRALMDPDAPRSGRVEVTLRDGRQVSHFTRFAPGTKENPLNTDGVNAKVRDLMAPVVGAQRAEQIIKGIHAIETVTDTRTLVRTLLTEV